MSILFVRWLIIIDYKIESTIRRLFFRNRYTLNGSCMRCGRCCEVIGVDVPAKLSRDGWIIRLVIAFYQRVNDFKFIGWNDQQSILLFNCKSFDSVTRRCRSYNIRPALCRAYPFIRFFAKPQLLPGCGYTVQKNMESVK